MQRISVKNVEKLNKMNSFFSLLSPRDDKKGAGKNPDKILNLAGPFQFI